MALNKISKVMLEDSVSTKIDKIDGIESSLADITTLVSSYKTTSNSWADALESCINFARTNNLKKIKLPKGNLTIDRLLSIGGSEKDWDLIIEGDGRGLDGRGTCLTYSGTGYMLSVNLSLPVAGQWRGITFRDMSFRGNGTNNGIALTFCQQPMFLNCSFHQFNKAIGCLAGSHYPKFLNVNIYSCTYGTYIPALGDEGHDPSDSSNNGSMDNCFFTDCANPFYQGDGEGWTIISSDFEGGNGAITINRNTELINVRVERNLPNTHWIHIKDEQNKIDIKANCEGSTQPTPLIKLDGDYNDITVNGNTLEIVDNPTGKFNNIKVVNYKPVVSRQIIKGMDKSNKLETLGRSTENLVSQDLTTWTMTSATITTSTFSNGQSCYQVVSNNATNGFATININGNFDNTKRVYFSCEYQNVAGGGHYIEVDGVQIGMIGLFDDVTQNKKTILSFIPQSTSTQLSVKIGSIGGNGAAFKVSNVVITSVLNDLILS